MISSNLKGLSRYGRKPVVEDCLKVSIADISKRGYLGELSTCSGQLRWGSTDILGGAEVMATISIVVSTLNYTFTASYKYGDAPSKSHTIKLTTTRPHYGGKRWWFVCPKTGERCANVYIYEGRISSRIDHGLIYQTQQEDEMNRLSTVGWRILKRHGIDCPGYFSKPKGMHRRTFDRLIEKSENYRYRAAALAGERFGGSASDFM